MSGCENISNTTSGLTSSRQSSAIWHRYPAAFDTCATQRSEGVQQREAVALTVVACMQQAVGCCLAEQAEVWEQRRVGLCCQQLCGMAHHSSNAAPRQRVAARPRQRACAGSCAANNLRYCRNASLCIQACSPRPCRCLLLLWMCPAATLGAQAGAGLLCSWGTC